MWIATWNYHEKLKYKVFLWWTEETIKKLCELGFTYHTTGQSILNNNYILQDLYAQERGIVEKLFREMKNLCFENIQF